MKKTAFSVLIFCMYFLFLIHPVSAGTLDTGVEMVAKGIDAYMELKAEKNLDNDFGVTFGNITDMENITPSQKLVYMVATAEQHPLKVKWVKDTLSSDIVYYYIFAFLILVVTFGFELLQKTWPEQISGVFQAFTGHDGFFDYTVMFKTTLKLALLPIISLPLIDFLISIEQAFSSGLMTDSLEYISFSSKTAGIWLFESIAYSITGTLFALRIQYINIFTANILKIILLLAITWGISEKIGMMMCAWFISALAMRPIVLWISSLAVQDIAHQQSAIAAVAATTADMSLVVVLSFVVAVIMVLWPVFMLILKVVCDYIMAAVYKAVRISEGLKVRR